MAFSTGEVDLESYIKADGGKINAGQLVRLLNVPISKTTVYHEYANGKEHADALKEACNNHYGAVGREWISYLTRHKEDAYKSVKEAEKRWLSSLPEQASEQVKRVASRFAILEAALLLSGSFTGWPEQECRDALQHGFNAWVNEFGTGNKEHKQIIEQAEAFLNSYGLSRFAPVPYDSTLLPIPNLAGYRDRKSKLDDSITFYTFPHIFEEEIAKGFNARAFAQVLADAGMLDKPNLNVDSLRNRFVLMASSRAFMF